MVLIECPIVKTVNCGSLAKQRPSGINYVWLKYKISKQSFCLSYLKRVVKGFKNGCLVRRKTVENALLFFFYDCFFFDFAIWQSISKMIFDATTAETP